MILEVRLIRFLFNRCLETNQAQSVLKMFLNFSYLLLSSAARYVVAALLNTSLSDKMFDSLSFIFSGIRLMMLGG